MKYIIAGPTIINDVEFTSGFKKNKVLGGSIFCLAGIALWDKSCVYISNVGADFKDYYGNWMDFNKCSYDGLNYSLPHTWYTKLLYEEKELHSEESIYGQKDEGILEKLDVITARQIAKHCNNDTKGIYLEASSTSDIWNNLSIIREICDAKLMWEIPTSSATNSLKKEETLKKIPLCDIYSLNGPEAEELFSTNSEKESIEKIQKLGIPCFFRVGKKGSYMITKTDVGFSKSIDVKEVVDTTGCGNTSTAAALYAFCEGFSNDSICKIGNISSAFNLMNYGPIINTNQNSLAKQLLKNENLICI